MPNTEIFGTLKLSFDGLDVSEKKIFLDIACFFKGGDEEYITRILDSFGFDPVIGISVLIEKSLITVSENRLDMHDLIQEMGWQIVRDSFSNSRLWQLKEIDGLIKRNQKLNAIEGILLWNNNDEKLGFSPEVFRSMENLRLLDIESKFTSHQPTFLPNELRWLCWYEYPFISLPVEHMCNLVGLQMSRSSIDHLWEGQKILPNLKYVDLSSSTYLTMFPDVSAAPNIEQLILSCCDSLVEVHESLGFHKRLAYLDMSFCRQLKCLPSRIEMESLETLILSQCLGLDRFPEVSPCMLKLSSIYLDYCYLIEDLPSSIRYLSGLGFLNLSGTSLKNIPNSVSELKHLKTLHLNDCNNLFQMPEELGTLEQLEELRLGFVKFVEIPISFSFLFPLSINLHSLASLCSLRKLDLSWRQIKEEDFPINLDAFSSLEELDLSGNSKLIQLHASISRLSNLKLLQLNDCHRLQNLNDLPSGLQVLKARGCSSLEKIGDLSKEYEWLYKIRLFDCPKLLEDQENRRYLDKMLEQSFLKKCAAVNHRLSIGIPGSNMPSWIKEQQHGCSIALKLPPKWHTQIMGFVVCGVFRKNWTHNSLQIMFRIVNDEKVILKSEVDCINASAGAHNGNVWIWYIPLGFFQQMDHDIQPKDWFHMEGNLVMTITTGYDRECVRCGADILYKEDMESIQQIQDCISDYEDDYVKVPRCDNEHVYHEKC